MSLSAVSKGMSLPKIDPCQVLHVEILEIIFGEIGMSQIVTTLMLVSKDWRYKIGQCEILWREYVIGAGETLNVCPRSLATDLLGPHVRHIKKYYIKTESTALVFALVAKHRFPNLQSLSVVGDYLSPLTQLGSHLLQFPKSLKTLNLDCINDPSVSLFMILNAFPALSNLTYRNTYSVRGNRQCRDIDPNAAAIQGCASVTTPTRLLTLELGMTAISRSMHTEILDDILSKCPNLRGLIIAPCKNIGSLLETISQKPRYCPDLSFLAVNPLQRPINVLDRFSRYQPLAAGGLSHLTIGPILVQDLAYLLLTQQNQASLEELSVYYDTQTVASARIHPSRLRMRFSRLRVLKFQGRADTEAEMALLDSILAGSPHLESLTLVSFISTARSPHTESLFRRMAKLQYLEHIQLSCCPDLPGLSTIYLDHMVALGHRCPLRTFSLRHGPVSQALLQQLGQVKTLHRVALVPILHHTIGCLVKSLAQSISIQTIALDSKQLADDSKAIIGQLARIKSLKQLSVSGTISDPEKILLQAYTIPYSLSIQFNEPDLL